MTCKIIIWLWLGLNPGCEGMTELTNECVYERNSRQCRFTATLNPELRTLRVVGPTDVATFDLPLDSGWKRFSWTERGEFAFIDGVGYRRKT